MENSNPAERRISFRRGELEARIKGYWRDKEVCMLKNRPKIKIIRVLIKINLNSFAFNVITFNFTTSNFYYGYFRRIKAVKISI
jgi:hypothetical protein